MNLRKDLIMLMDLDKNFCMSEGLWDIKHNKENVKLYSLYINKDVDHFTVMVNDKLCILSMQSPEYLINISNPECWSCNLTAEEKRDLMEALSYPGVWEEICTRVVTRCTEDCLGIKCNHRLNNIPKSLPDYNLL